jgi:hypothetical protein
MPKPPLPQEAPYRNRDQARVSGWIEIERWHAWVHGQPWHPA